MEQTSTTTRDGGMPPSDVVDVVETIAAIGGLMARLADADLSVLPDEAFDAALLDFEEVTRIGGYVAQRLAGETESRGRAEVHGHPRTVPYLRDALRIRESEAKARLTGFERLHPRTALTGEVSPPAYPHLAAAVKTGEVSTGQAHVVTSSLRRLPDAVPVETVDAAERELLGRAREWEPVLLDKHARNLENYLDPDGLLLTEHDRKQRLSLTMGRGLHGMYEGRLVLDGEARNLLNLALERCPHPNKDPAGNVTRGPRAGAARKR